MLLSLLHPQATQGHGVEERMGAVRVIARDRFDADRLLQLVRDGLAPPSPPHRHPCFYLKKEAASAWPNGKVSDIKTW